jgi:uncharacterized integral membrane protein
MDDALVWNANWAWSLPLIVVSVMYHALGLAFVNQNIIRAKRIVESKRNHLILFALVMGITTLLVTLLHATEAGIWAGLYWMLGALPDGKSALLYSLGAMTTYGHEPFYLAAHWRLMGALEALSGMILFGLTTAFLYATIREFWPERPSNGRELTMQYSTPPHRSDKPGDRAAS